MADGPSITQGAARPHTEFERYLDETIKFFETARDENNEEYEVWLWWKDDRKYFLEEGRLFKNCGIKARGYLKDYLFKSTHETRKADEKFVREKENEYLYLTPDEELTYQGQYEKAEIDKKIHYELKKYLITTHKDILEERLLES